MDSCLRGNTIPLGQARWKAAILTALIVAGVLAMFALPAATTTAECQFILGFATLKALIDAAEGPDKVGDCLENQRFNPENGDALQQTTGGLLVWRKADNWTAFTDGYRTWINGPYGLQARLNTEQFDWEGPPQASPAPAIEIGAEYTAQCSNGGAVRNPQANPGLVADCAALLQGRDTLAGSAALNWRAERAIVNWEGVTVGGSPHRVTGLRLNNQFINYRPMSKTYPTDDLQPGFPFVMSGHGGFYGWGSQLTGTIPPALGALNQLETLSLGGNQLTGPIPPQLAVLNQLETLDLGDNQLAGPIPSQLGTISNLRGLFLNDNQLAGPIPPELSSLTRLQLLDLSDNRLTGPIPRQLDSLTNLLGVWLDSNQLSGSIPPQVAVLTHLRRLDLSGNQLSGPIPPQVAALTQLGRLDLNDNRLTGPIPPQMGALTQLFSLNLSSNQLSGPIPPQLAALFRLTTRSNWGSFPPGGLYLGGNALTGCIPLGLGDVLENDFDTLRIPFCGAEYTAQCSNGIAVPNPQDNHRLVADCTALLHGRDTLAGSATLNWRADRAIAYWNGVTVGGSPPRVTKLQIFERRLTGTIPPELGALTQLEVLYLGSNRLTGPIPPQLATLSNLQGLNLNSNDLTGPILPQLAALSNLESLDLRDNLLTGPIPPQLGALTHLRWLDLGFNQLTGPIPLHWGTLRRLLRLDLSHNQLTGPIPPELGTLTNLEWLILSENQLSGPIPPQLGALANWEHLSLGGNVLTGCIPEGLRGVPRNDFAELGLPFCGA